MNKQGVVENTILEAVVATDPQEAIEAAVDEERRALEEEHKQVAQMERDWEELQGTKNEGTITIAEVVGDGSDRKEEEGSAKRRTVCSIICSVLGIGILLLILWALGVFTPAPMSSFSPTSQPTPDPTSQSMTPSPTSRQPTCKEWRQLGQAINGEAPGDESGYSVSISAHGSRVAIGARSNNGSGRFDSGRTRIYDYNASTKTWEKIGNDINGEAQGDLSGHSVSISADGSSVAIGAYLNDGNGPNSGHTRVYKYNVAAKEWVKVGEDIDGEAANDRSGNSVSISANGSRVAIGAERNDSNGNDRGSTRIYEYHESVWNQIGKDIDGEAANDRSGYSVSISADGFNVAIGAPQNSGNSGTSGHTRIYKYHVTKNDWVQLGSDIDGTDNGEEAGGSVSMSEDGSRVVIGATMGETRVYQYNKNEGWKQIGSNITGAEVGDESGSSVSISGNGRRMATGANKNDDIHTRVYDFDGSDWTQIGSDIIINGGKKKDGSGFSISINADGSRVAIGSPYNDDENGAESGNTRIYECSS